MIIQVSCRAHKKNSTLNTYQLVYDEKGKKFSLFDLRGKGSLILFFLSGVVSLDTDVLGSVVLTLTMSSSRVVCLVFLPRAVVVSQSIEA